MSKKEKTFIQVFNTQAEVLSKVNEFKAQGYDEKDMYVVAQDKHSSLWLRIKQTLMWKLLANRKTKDLWGNSWLPFQMILLRKPSEEWD